MMGMGMADGWGLYPWLNNSQNINDGFREQMLQTTISSTNDRLASLSTQLCDCCGNISSQLCNGFNGVNMAVNTAQNAIAQQLYGNQIATLQGFNGVNTGVADLRYTVATEACADRAAVGDALQNVTMQNMGNTNQIVSAITAGIQSIKDDLCADRLDAERRENQNLRTQLSMAQLAASQVAQTSQIERGQLAATTALVNELRSCPIPSQPVYGNQPIFTCPNNNNGGCGCGCGGNF
ncbi:MAG: hypothetical protein J6S85_10300 [Methanobrevibacter sp.]|nr:hypothetical protein [Methanobrevibacter sp.]